jgi:hypothetical protein
VQPSSKPQKLRTVNRPRILCNASLKNRWNGWISQERVSEKRTGEGKSLAEQTKKDVETNFMPLLQSNACFLYLRL